MTDFSVVERQVKKRCERKWGLQSENMESLEPVKPALPLLVGGMVHETLAAWTEFHFPSDPTGATPKTNDPNMFYVGRAAHYVELVEQDYRQRIGAAMSDDEEAAMLDAITLGQAMIKNYLDYYKVPLPAGFKSVRTEQRAFVDIPGTEHRLRGTIDNLVQDQQGKLWVLERKTYAIRPTVQKLQADDQILAYIWMLVQLFGQDQVGGCLYDGLWKRDISKRHPNLEELFFRHQIVRPPEELEEFGRLLAIEVEQMEEAMKRGLENLTINRRWEGCYDCGMVKLCEAMSRGEDVDYVRSTFYRRRIIEDLDSEDSE